MGALTMTTAEREAFLAEVRVGLLAVERDDGPPLAVPIWYAYEPGGELWFVTDGDSLKGRLLQRAGRCTLCVQEETPPAYSYVSVEGPCRIEPADLEAHTRVVARRYLGERGGDGYVESTPRSPSSVRVVVRPERWFSVDYGKAGAG